MYRPFEERLDSPVCVELLGWQVRELVGDGGQCLVRELLVIVDAGLAHQ